MKTGPYPCANRIALLLLLAWFMATSACSLLPARQHNKNTGAYYFELLQPAQLGDNIGLVQHFTFEHSNRRQTLLIQSEVHAHGLAMVASTLSCATLFTLTMEQGRHALQGELPLQPDASSRIDPKHILTDFQLTYWPKNHLSKALENGSYQLIDGDGYRQLRTGDSLVVDIRYSRAERWLADIEFHHYPRKYHYRVRTLQHYDPDVPIAASETIL